MARWVLKKGAPRHYIRGVGLVRFGDDPFDHPGPAESEWWERVDADPEPAPAKPAKAKRDAVPIGPAPVPPSEDSGTF